MIIRIAPAEDRGLSLDVIQIDGGTQSRATLNQHVVDDYAEAIKAGATFPPIVVFYDGKKHWLADGFHRFHAYQKAGRTNVPADVRQGTRRDAILHSVGANETHGLRRTRDDKRRAVLTLLNDSEWSKWSDREIARQCAVHHTYVGKLRPVTGDNTSEDREYTTKHGTTATMKTAGINASRTQFQAKASEDNGSITGGAGAVTGEASRLASGRTDAGEAASVDLPTNSDAVGDTDAIRAGHITRYHVLQLRSAWTKANAEARSIFLVEFNLRQESNPATATGGDDVDRSAERASSAVEVGAPVSPEGAQGIPAGSHGQRHDLVAGPVDRQDKSPITAGAVASASETNSPSAAHPVEAVADNPQVPRPSATAKEFPDPQYSGVATADPAHQVPKLSGAKSDVPHVVGQGCTEQVESLGYSGQEPAVKSQGGNSAASGEPASVTQFNNPRCLNACHFAHSRDACHECLVAWSQRPKDEQIRLWAEANEAGKAA